MRSPDTSVAPGGAIAPSPDAAPDNLDFFYNWDDIEDEAVGVIVAGNSGAAKSSVACWLAGHLTRKNPAQVLALDPHESRNPSWKQLGIPVIGDFAAIEEQVGLMIELLDQRREQPENGDEIIVFADELGACLDRFKDSAKMERALKRLGSEGRKFGLTFIAINQSKNVADIGISGALRNNYVIVLLCAAAREHAEKKWKQSDPRRVYVNSVAYPCVVTGAVPDKVAIHPTHAEYLKFKKKGNPPKNLIPIDQLPLTIPLATSHQHLRRREQPANYGDRYADNWRQLSAEAKHLANGRCCYPGCSEPAAQTHHAYYQDERGAIAGREVPGESIFPLCDRHHSESDPAGAHHWKNWMKDPFNPALGNRNAPEYLAALRQGWQLAAGAQFSKNLLDAPLSPAEKHRVLQLWSAGITAQQSLVETVWNVRKGGSSYWAKGCDRARQIISEAGFEIPW